MELFVVACHYTQSGSLIGLRILDVERSKVADSSVANVKDNIKNRGLHIHDVSVKGNKLNIVNRIEYTKFVDGNLVGESKSVVISDLAKNNQRVIASCNGVTQLVSNSTVEKAIMENKISNAKIVNGVIVPVGEAFVSFSKMVQMQQQEIEASKKTIESEVSKVRAIEEKKRSLESNRDKKKKLVGGDIDEINRSLKNSLKFKPTIIQGKACDTSKIKEYGPDKLNAEQKFINLITRLRNSRPFLYSVIYSLNRVISDEVKRAGATVDTLYINPEYLRDTSMEELLFVVSHELYHVVMRHSARENRRNHKLWNIACDLYINKLLTEDFGIPLDENRAVEVENNGTGLGFYVMRYHDIYYSSTINVNKDTPEKIYEELLMEFNKNNQNNKSNDDNNSDNSNEQSDDNNSNDNDDSSDESSGESSGSSSDSSEGEQDGENKQGGSSGFKYRDIKINPEDFDDDMIEDSKTVNMSEEQKKNRSKSIVNRAVTIQKQIAGFGGPTSSVLERLVALDLAPKVNWKTLLKKYLIAASETYTSYSSPDKRFLSRDMLLPGPKVDEEGGLENVKLFIDTSGSISDRELGMALSQIKQLLNAFNAKAEVLYWDTSVRNTVEFDDIDTLLKSKPTGGGGTDANCIFKYFDDNRDYKIGKKQLPSVIVVFTDGYFSDVDIKYKKYRNVIWIVHDNPGFTSKIGTVAHFNYNE